MTDTTAYKRTKRTPIWITITGLYALAWIVFGQTILYGLLAYYHDWRWCLVWLTVHLADLARHMWLTKNDYTLKGVGYSREDT